MEPGGDVPVDITAGQRIPLVEFDGAVHLEHDEGTAVDRKQVDADEIHSHSPRRRDRERSRAGFRGFRGQRTAE